MIFQIALYEYFSTQNDEIQTKNPIINSIDI